RVERREEVRACPAQVQGKKVAGRRPELYLAEAEHVLTAVVKVDRLAVHGIGHDGFLAHRSFLTRAREEEPPLSNVAAQRQRLTVRLVRAGVDAHVRVKTTRRN